MEDLHVPGIGSRAIDGLGCDLGAPTCDLGERGVLENTETGSKLGIGEEEIPQPAAAGLGLQLLDHSRVMMGVAGLLHLPLVHVLSRVDRLVHECQQTRPQLLDPLAVGELHRGGKLVAR